MGPGSTVLMPGNGSLLVQFDQAKAILAQSGWFSDAMAARATSAVAQAVAMPGVRLSRYLTDQGVLTSEQAAELECVLDHQGHFPTFRLLRKLGAGGMGTVFLADRIADGRRVALKTLNPRLADEGDFVSRFEREAQALAGLRHPHVAQVVDSGGSSGHLFIALEFIDGPSLMAMVKDYRRLPEPYALRVVRQVADGLHHVWTAAGLVHRDIKPENILVLRNRSGTDLFSDQDVAKLIDFGLVKPTEGDDERVRLTQTGMTIGTPLYMSPEQIRGETLDCRSDIYALGATLYHMLTGTVPFAGTSPGAIMSAHLTEPVPDPGTVVPELSAACRELVRTCLAKKPADRFADHMAFARALDKVAAGGGSTTVRFLKKPLRAPGKPRVPTPPPPPLPMPGQAPAPAAVTPAPPPAPGSAAPVAVARSATPVEVGGVGLAMPAAPVATARSRVYDEDPQAQGIGIMPWLVLGAALIAFLIYMALS
jgi:serine/threonine protein kinase